MSRYILSVEEFINKLLVEEKLNWTDTLTLTEGNSKPSYMITGVEDDGYFGVYQIKYDSSLTFHEYLDTEEGSKEIKNKINKNNKYGRIDLKGDLTIRELIRLSIENNIDLDTVILFEDMSDGGYSPWSASYLDYTNKSLILCVS